MGSSKNKLCRSSRVESSFDDFFLISLVIAEASSSFSLELFFAAFRFPISFEIVFKEACNFLNFPVVSGNVSFYNETKDKGIKPTPTIGGVGIIKDYKKMISMDLKEIDNIILVIGKTEGHIDQSIFARTILDDKNGPPPEVNLFNEKNNGLSVQTLIDKKLVNSVHDISSGGILVALTEMCICGKIVYQLTYWD